MIGKQIFAANCISVEILCFKFDFVTDFNCFNRLNINKLNSFCKLIDINSGAPTAAVTSSVGARQWTLTNAWVTKYSAPDLDAKNSDIAIESVEIAYEELVIPN